MELSVNTTREALYADRPDVLVAPLQSGYSDGMDDLQYISIPPQLSSIKERTLEIQFPMASEPLVGAMLRVLAASKPNGRFLELGTGTGLSTACLLSGMDAGSTLISVDNDSAVQQVAGNSLRADGRLTLVTSGGLEYLRDQAPESFDFVFADAIPGKYEGLEEALAV